MINRNRQKEAMNIVAKTKLWERLLGKTQPYNKQHQ